MKNESEIYATIKDLKINNNRKINFIEKKKFAEIIEAEFSNQRTIFDSQISEARDKMNDEYKKSIGYDKLQKKLSAAEYAVSEIKKEISSAGFDCYGKIMYSSSFSKEDRENHPEIYRRLKSLEDGIQALQDRKPLNLQNKIVSRLWLTDTMGEVLVILNEVLGNGMLPRIQKDQLALMYKEEEK